MPPICSYYLCTNASGQKPLFRFPTGDSVRLEVWLNNCGNMDISHLPPSRLRNKFLCIEHFHKKFIRNEKGQRVRLNKLAVPLCYKGDEHIERSSPVPSTSQGPQSPELRVIPPKRVYSGPKRKILHEESTKSNTPTTPKIQRKRINLMDTPKCKKLKKSLMNTSKILKRLRNQNLRLKKKLLDKNVVHLNKVKFKGDLGEQLTRIQFKKQSQQWTEEEKKFCLSLYYKSPSTYKYLRKGGVVLAAPTTIQKWLQSTNCLPGINNDIFENINQKFADQSIKYKSCAVCYDEMSIKTDLEYTNKFDLIEGFEDFGGDDRSPMEAKYALVFVARGIYDNWKIPLAYFLSHKNVNSDKLIILIKSIINKLFISGLLPKVIICDQASTNVKAIKSMGATKDDPFIFIDNHKIYTIFDVPHLIKNIRNNLMDSNFDLNGNEISFNDIISVYNIDKCNKSKSIRKLTPVHLKPNSFQKMRVKYAVQVLSHSVAAAIHTAVDTGELKSETAKNTADFLQIINDLFDSLNSKNKFDLNPYRCALTKNKNSHVYQSLIKGKSLLADLKKKMILKNNSIKLTCPPCFEGMQLTINAVLQFSSEEFSKGTEVKFLMTYRLNQDVIENLFGIFRMRGGCNRNPTAKNLRAIFRSNFLNNLIKLENTNCESDNDTFVSYTNNDQQNTQPMSEASCSYSSNPVEHEHDGPGPSHHHTINNDYPDLSIDLIEESLNCSSSNKSIDIRLETCSVVYFAGWLGKVCVEKFDCLMCKQKLINDGVELLDKKQLLLINKTYSNLVVPTLKSPSDFLFNLVDQILDLFNKRIDNIHQMHVVLNLIAYVKDVINIPDDYHNIDHLDFLIKKLLEVKIHDYCKSRKSSFDSRSKLKILHNK